MAAGAGARADSGRRPLPVSTAGVRHRRRHPVADRHDHPRDRAVPAPGRWRRRRRGGAAGDGAHPAESVAVRAAGGARGLRRGGRCVGDPGAGAAPRRPAARRARTREGAGAAAAAGRLAVHPGIGARDRPHLALPAQAASRAAATGARPRVGRAGDAESPRRGTSGGLPLRRRRAAPRVGGRSGRDRPGGRIRRRLARRRRVRARGARGAGGGRGTAESGRASSGSIAGDQNLIAAMRPLVVDLLTATGMPPADARHAVPRI